MKVVIDRFEGSYAICEKESREMININRAVIPAEATEGTVLYIHNDTITIDVDETKKRKAEIRELTKDLWQ